MPKGSLHVIPEPPPNTRAVFVYDGPKDGFIMRGEGKWDFSCGACGRVLLKNMVDNQVQGPVFKCQHCGAFNDSVLPNQPQ